MSTGKRNVLRQWRHRPSRIGGCTSEGDMIATLIPFWKLLPSTLWTRDNCVHLNKSLREMSYNITVYIILFLFFLDRSSWAGSHSCSPLWQLPCSMPNMLVHLSTSTHSSTWMRARFGHLMFTVLWRSTGWVYCSEPRRSKTSDHWSSPMVRTNLTSGVNSNHWNHT